LYARVAGFENRDVTMTDELVGRVRSLVGNGGAVPGAGRHMLLLAPANAGALTLTFFGDEVERITARKVADICSREVVTCTPETPVTEIAELMTEKKAHLVPVVDGGKVIGVVARLDIVRSMGR